MERIDENKLVKWVECGFYIGLVVRQAIATELLALRQSHAQCVTALEHSLGCENCYKEAEAALRAAQAVKEVGQ